MDFRAQASQVLGVRPVLTIQDAFVTDESLGMPSTVGSAVFATMKAKQSASLIDRVSETRNQELGRLTSIYDS